MPLGFLLKATKYLGLMSLDFLDQKSAAVLEGLFRGHYRIGGNVNSPAHILTVGYSNWKDYLYTRENILKWSEAVKHFWVSKSHPTTFVITEFYSAGVKDPSRGQVSQLISSLKKLDIQPVNCTKRYEGVRPRKEWANLADRHPGESETDFYSQCVQRHLSRYYNYH